VILSTIIRRSTCAFFCIFRIFEQKHISVSQSGGLGQIERISEFFRQCILLVFDVIVFGFNAPANMIQILEIVRSKAVIKNIGD
jgi:hypothetical protein